jgi:IstB-like ATP binding protein
MERTEVLDMMGELKLYGMRNAYDETLATAVKRQHEPQHFVGDLLKAEIYEKQARSIKYQLTVAKLPLATSTTSRSTQLLSMRAWCAISQAATSSLSSAMSFL